MNHVDFRRALKAAIRANGRVQVCESLGVSDRTLTNWCRRMPRLSMGVRRIAEAYLAAYVPAPARDETTNEVRGTLRDLKAMAGPSMELPTPRPNRPGTRALSKAARRMGHPAGVAVRRKLT